MYVSTSILSDVFNCIANTIHFNQKANTRVYVNSDSELYMKDFNHNTPEDIIQLRKELRSLHLKYEP